MAGGLAGRDPREGCVRLAPTMRRASFIHGCRACKARSTLCVVHVDQAGAVLVGGVRCPPRKIAFLFRCLSAALCTSIQMPFGRPAQTPIGAPPSVAPRGPSGRDPREGWAEGRNGLWLPGFPPSGPLGVQDASLSARCQGAHGTSAEAENPATRGAIRVRGTPTWPASLWGATSSSTSQPSSHIRVCCMRI